MEIKIYKIEVSRGRELTPCKLCGRYDDKVKPAETPTGVELGSLHPHCASRILHEAMKELIHRMS